MVGSCITPPFFMDISVRELTSYGWFMYNASVHYGHIGERVNILWLVHV